MIYGNEYSYDYSQKTSKMTNSTVSTTKYLPIITGIFCSSLLISNTLDTKLFMAGPFALTTGLLLFPIAYLFGDILTEVYGFKASRRVIWTGFFCLALMVIFYEIARIITPAPFWPHQEAFENVLGRVPRIVAASMIAYFAGEYTNSVVVAKMKIRSNGQRMALRFVVSTIFGQAVDTVVFVLIAFTGLMTFGELGLVIFSGWLFKVLWEIIVLPVTIYVVKWLKREEGLDAYDHDTAFTPFKF